MVPWIERPSITFDVAKPKERQFETFWVMIDEAEIAFQRDSFTGLWYFGNDESAENLIPCSRQEYDAAKRGDLHRRFSK